jgi:hypothetical protein
MVGLLDPKNRNALSMGLLNFGGGLMAAGAPTTDPGASQRLMGQAVQGFGNAYQGAQQQQMQQELQAQKIAQAKQAAARRQAMSQQLNTILGGSPTGTAAPAAGGPLPLTAPGATAPGAAPASGGATPAGPHPLVANMNPTQLGLLRTMAANDPEAAMGILQEQAFASPKERRIIKGADGFQYYADDGTRVLPNAQKAPKKERFTINEGDTQKTYIGDPTDPATWQSVAEAPRYKPGTDVTIEGDQPLTPFEKEMGENAAKDATAVLSAASNAEGTLARVRAMRDILPTIGSGPVAQLAPSLQAFAADLGVDVGATAERLGVDLQDRGNAAEFSRLSKELAQESLNAFKGSTSNRELTFAQDTVANLGKDERANAAAIAAMEVMAERTQEYGAKLLEMFEAEGETNATYRKWQKWRNEQARENPIEKIVAERAQSYMPQRTPVPQGGGVDYKTKYGLQ